MSDTTLGTNVPLRTQIKQEFKQHIKTAESVSADTNRYGNGVLKGKLIDKQPVQDIFQKGFGVSIDQTGKNVQMVGKKLSAENLAAMKKAGISRNVINKFKEAGKNEAKVVINANDLNSYIAESGTKKLKKSGISLKETADGWKLGVNGSITEEQTKLLKKAGISKETIEKLGKSKSALIQNVNKEALIQKIGKEEVNNFAKSAGIKIEEVTTSSIKAGNAKFAEKIGLKTASLYQKVASKFGKEVTDATVKGFGKSAGKNVSKIAAVSARGMAGIPIAGALIMGAFEIPNIISAYKNEGVSGAFRQTLRSVNNVGVSMVGGSIGGAIGTVVGGILIPGPVGMAVGAFVGDAIGGIAGYSVGEVASNAVFGKAKTAEETQNTTNPEAGTNTENPVTGYIADTSYMDPYLTNPFIGTATRKSVEVLR